MKGKKVDRVDITGVDLVEFVKKVYELSNLQGLGALHFQSGGLSDQEASDLVERCHGWADSSKVISMDYVHGRACKMDVQKKDGKLFIRCPWYDHTDAQLKQLLNHFDIKLEDQEEHSDPCNCAECREKIGKEPEDAMGDLMKTGGLVSKKCKLDGMLSFLLARTGEDPCAGCNIDRLECDGRPKSYEYKGYSSDYVT